MNVNWIVIGIVVFCCLVVIYFLIKKNLKDEKEYEEYLSKNDDPKYLGDLDKDDL